jgi:hypothetical protein
MHPVVMIEAKLPIIVGGRRSMDSINAVASDLIEADGAEEAPRVARRASQNVLAIPLADERLPKNPPHIVHEVAMEYRRACRLAARATVPEYEQAAVDAAVRRYKEVDPTAPLNRHDAVAAVLEMVGNVILADHLWFWDGPDV